ncbi:MAG: beta-galactosidase [Parcubacteria group bacterium]|jgi:hypothetical protein
MKNKFIYVSIAVLILVLTLFLGVFLFRSKTAKKITQNQKSEVKIVDGQPKLFVGGKELKTAITQLYYFPEERAQKDVPGYSTDEWTKRMEKVIDDARKNDTQIVIPQIWWSDVDKATARSSEPEKYYDFGSLDKIMDYASRKGEYIMIGLSLHRYAPEWWLKENNFPPYSEGKVCDFCETDSYGNVYSNPGMGSDVTEKDLGSFMKAAVNRYKNHPALIGWVTGIGATSEDNYGPNYIMLQGAAGGIGEVERKQLMFTDYSPYFQRKFNDWIKNKYRVDSALQNAWSDTKVTMNNVAIPPAEELIKDTSSWIGLFPEESQGNLGGDINNLSAKGKDFYEFRTYMANTDRNFYADLFKSNDPNHILAMNTSGSKSVMENSKIDALIRNDSLCFDCPPTKMRENQYAQITSSIKNASSKKLTFTAFEYGSAQQGKAESNEQIAYTKTLGKAVKCAGGIFGYVSDLATENANLYPNWFSSSAQKSIFEITGFVPSSGCDCNLVKDLWQKNKCDAGGNSGCQYISKAYGDYCKVSVPEQKTIAPQNNQPNQPPIENSSGNDRNGKCGDGTCDSIEKTSGMCPTDCK